MPERRPSPEVRGDLGFDEVGRGAWAGPVTAAAVLLPEGFAEDCVIGDSKKLAPVVRVRSAGVLLRTAFVGIGSALNSEIDEYGIVAATALAMRRAAAALPDGLQPRRLLIDGAAVLPGIGERWPGVPCEAVIRGDASVRCIGAASIVAKVVRDTAMQVLDTVYPGYGFASHVGYGTAAHRAALQMLGVLPVHRQSFAPIRNYTATGALMPGCGL